MKTFISTLLLINMGMMLVNYSFGAGLSDTHIEVDPELPQIAYDYIEEFYPDDEIEFYEYVDADEEFIVTMESETILYFDEDGIFLREEKPDDKN